MSKLSETARKRASYYLNVAFDLEGTSYNDRKEILHTLIEIKCCRVTERYNDMLTEYPEHQKELKNEFPFL